MKKYNNKLSRSMMTGCASFFIALCLIMGIAGYFNIRHMLYERYQLYVTDLLYYTRSGIDADDLEQCMKTGKKSEKYEQLQVFLDQIKNYHSAEFIYIIQPLNTHESDNIKNVIAAMSQYEKKFVPENKVELNELTGTSYSSKTAAQYLACMTSSEKVFFFEETAEWGTAYTGVLPIINSSGHAIALLAVDVSINDVKYTLQKYVLTSIAATLFLGMLLLFGVMFWIHRRIIDPIKKLDSSVTSFAKNSIGQRDPGALIFHDPNIHTDDEIESLSDSIIKLSEDMKTYAENLLSAENKVALIQEQTLLMNELAFKDALTSVKNKAAFHKAKERLNWDIINQSAEFALVLVNVNFLKKINDEFGHEKGDLYIKNACQTVCRIYSHSPVYRIGGDEFLVVLEKSDYENRNELLEKMQSSFRVAASNKDLSPWERVSAAAGMAIYDRTMDPHTDAVLARAETLMNENKLHHKGQI